VCRIISPPSGVSVGFPIALFGLVPFQSYSPSSRGSYPKSGPEFSFFELQILSGGRACQISDPVSQITVTS